MAQPGGNVAGPVVNGQQGRFALAPLPPLGTNVDFVDWQIRLSARAGFHGFRTDAIIDPLWKSAQQFIVANLGQTGDQAAVQAATILHWTAAMACLRQTYMPNPRIAILNRKAQLNSIRILPNESVMGLIARARTLQAHLQFLDAAVDASDVLAAVIAALKAAPLHAASIGQFLTITPDPTIALMIQHFGVLADSAEAPVAGALLAHAAPSKKRPGPPAPGAEYLTSQQVMAAITSCNDRMVDTLKHFLERSDLKPAALSVSAKGDQGRAPSPVPDLRGTAQKPRLGWADQQRPATPDPRARQDDRRPRQDQGRGRQRDDRRGQRDDRRSGDRSERDRDTRSMSPRKQYCRNCGATDHMQSKCPAPCSGCKSTQHYFTACPGNVGSFNYDPDWTPPNAGAANLAERHQGEIYMAQGMDVPLPPMPPIILPPMGGSMNMGYDAGYPSEVHMVDGYSPEYGEVPASALSAIASHGPQWILDSGATHHVTPDLRQLHNLQWDLLPCKLKVANKEFLERKAIGTLKVSTTVGSQTYIREIHHVWYVPGLSRSLLSVQQLKKSGNWHHGGFDGDLGETFCPKGSNQPWLYCPYVNGLNVVDWSVQLNPSVSTPEDDPGAHLSSCMAAMCEASALHTLANRAADPETAELWHMRLGHVSCRTLSDLIKHQKITGITTPPAEIAKFALSCRCPVCIMAKMNRATFGPKQSPATKPLQVLHTDLCGPYPVRTLGQHRYVCTMLDEFTEFGDVALLTTKDQTKAALSQMILKAEAATGHKCSKVYSDRGGEYIAEVLQSWFLERGIEHEPTIPQQSQQNGRAERLNQTLNNMVRAMLFQYNVYLPLWGHAMRYACHIRNVTTCNRLGMTPHEAYYHQVPHVAGLRVFGCKVLARLPESQRKKLTPKAMVGLFVGLCPSGAGYQVLMHNPALKRALQYSVHIVRDIVTYEQLATNSGVTNAADLQWGGGIPLPAITVDPEEPAMLESTTGTGMEMAPLQPAGVSTVAPLDYAMPLMLLPPPPPLPLQPAPAPPPAVVAGAGAATGSASPASGAAGIAPLAGNANPGRAGNPPPATIGPPGPGIAHTRVTRSAGPTAASGGLPGHGMPVDPFAPGVRPAVASTSTSRVTRAMVSAGDAQAPPQHTWGAPVPDARGKRVCIRAPSGSCEWVYAFPLIGDAHCSGLYMTPPTGPSILTVQSHEMPKSLLANQGVVELQAGTGSRVVAQAPATVTARGHRLITPPSGLCPGPLTVTRVPQACGTPTIMGTTVGGGQTITSGDLGAAMQGGNGSRQRLVEALLTLAQEVGTSERASELVNNAPVPVTVPSAPPSAPVYLPDLDSDFGGPMLDPFAVAFLMEAPFPQCKPSDIPTQASVVEGLLRHFNVPEQHGEVPLFSDAAQHQVPGTLTEAMEGPYARQWAEAAVAEWYSLNRNGTWTLIESAPWMKILPCKWVFVLKQDEHGNPTRFKARLVAGGHRQVDGVDYGETYAPVSRLTTLRILLAVAARHGWPVYQLDIKTAFLHGDIDTDVYMRQPPGFVDGTNLVCHLTKCLYGLRQAPRAWYEKLSALLTSLGLEACAADASLWIGKNTPYPLFLATVVDDVALTSSNSDFAKSISAGILACYEGTDMGIISQYNGMRIVWLPQSHACVVLQTAHIDALAATFGKICDIPIRQLPMPANMKFCIGGTSANPNSPPLDTATYKYRALIGSLTYLVHGTRPDAVYTVNQLARYSNAPTWAHWEVALGCLGYLVHTKWWGIVLGRAGMPVTTYSKVSTSLHQPPPLPPGVDAVAYADANHGTGLDDYRSVSGTLIQVFGGPVTWSSARQLTQAISTVDSEIHAMSCAAREASWVAKLLAKFDVPCRPFLIRGDSLGGIQAVTKYTYTKHAKHIGIHQDFMRDRVQNGEYVFEHVQGVSNPADIFTKPLALPLFQAHRHNIGMMELPLHLQHPPKPAAKPAAPPANTA